MAEGITKELIIESLSIGLAGYLLLCFYLPRFVAFGVAAIKILIPLIYFSFYFDGSWTFYDDINYQIVGTKVLQTGYNPLTALMIPEGRDLLMALSGGSHFLYGWWNLLGQYLFGTYYFAPVFLNVFLSFVCGYFLFRVALLCDFSRIYSQWLAVFFLLHWELLSWSSFFNLKDVMVLTLTIMSFYCVLRLSKGVSIRHLIALGLIVYIFLWVRFYVPGLILFAIFIWASFFQKGFRKYLLIFLGIGGFFSCFNYFASMESSYLVASLMNPKDLLFGFFKILLTPKPWSLDIDYQFLQLSAILHWIFFIPMVIGAWLLVRRSKEMILLIVYLLIILIFYGSTQELLGIRPRFQVMFIIAWCQFHFFMFFLESKPIRSFSENRSIHFAESSTREA